MKEERAGVAGSVSVCLFDYFLFVLFLTQLEQQRTYIREISAMKEFFARHYFRSMSSKSNQNLEYGLF